MKQLDSFQSKYEQNKSCVLKRSTVIINQSVLEQLHLRRQCHNKNDERKAAHFYNPEHSHGIEIGHISHRDQYVRTVNRYTITAARRTAPVVC